MSLSQYGPIAGFVGQAYDELASMSTTRLLLFLVVNIPILIVIFNAIYQLVCELVSRGHHNVSDPSTVAQGPIVTAGCLALDPVVWLRRGVRRKPDKVLF